MHHGYSWLVCLHDTKHPEAWIIWRPCLTRIFSFHWDRLMPFRLKQSKCISYQFWRIKVGCVHCGEWQLKQREGRREGGRMNRIDFCNHLCCVDLLCPTKEGSRSSSVFNCPCILKGAVQIMLIIPIYSCHANSKVVFPFKQNQDYENWYIINKTNLIEFV